MNVSELTHPLSDDDLHTSMPRLVRVPALIVGGGPVGLYASSLLSSFGVQSLMADRLLLNAATRRHPRSHYINSRTMELLRELGVDGAVRQQTPPVSDWQHFRYCTSLLGTEIAAQDHACGSAWSNLSTASASEVAHLSQPKLEAILRAEAERRGPTIGAELLNGYECVHFEQNNSGVRAELRRVAHDAVSSGGANSLDDDVIEVEADYLLACDGAHSNVRRSLGLQLRGPPPLQYFKSVHFVAPELAPRLRALEREAMLYFVFSRGAICVLVAHNIEQGEWVAQLPYFPGLQDADTLDADACARAIASCIGGGNATISDADAASSLPFEIRSIGSWAMSAKVAQRLSLGRVHLLGDAAHQFPPAGAFGANTGLQDAHNLCWKIGLVHHGRAGVTLLSSYDTERRPVALANARLSVHNYHRGLRVAEALGLPSQLPHTLARIASNARSAAEAVLSPPPQLKPAASRVANSIGTQLLDAGRAMLIDGLGHNAPHAVGQMRRENARRVVDAGRALPLLFARHELGFIYPVSTPAQAASTAAAQQQMHDEADDEDEARIEDERYVPSTRPGARLPHHWLEGDNGEKLSTHDLLHDRGSESNGDEEGSTNEQRESVGSTMPCGWPPRLTLLVDTSAAGECWLVGAAQLDELARGLVRLVAIASPAEAAQGERGRQDDVDCADARTSREPPRALGTKHNALVARDLCGGWATKRGVGAGGAILVRPDGHVAWRCERDAVADDEEAGTLLREALSCALSLP
jgi:2-polyprenyl-6-methoxyphenol hydroxylase-like FAD-dependent oxidoreductase